MSEPIRVLQVFSKMDVGGAESMIMNYYRNIDRSKIQFDFVVHTTKKGFFDDEIEKLGGKIFRVPVYNAFTHFKYIQAWKDLFKGDSQYKIIHGHVRSTATIFLSIAKKNGLVTIAHSHSTSSGKGHIAFIKNIYQYPIRYISDYFVACSVNAGAWLFGEKKIVQDNFYILNNAIDTRKYFYSDFDRNIIREEFKIGDKMVLGHIGRFNYPKNHSFLIDVFSKVKEKKEDTILILVGDGPLKKDIQNKIINLGLEESVIFTGLRKDVNNLLKGMDIFLFPSIYEGFPVTLIEAQATGVNCIVSQSITRDTEITNLVEFLPIDQGAHIWADRILKKSSHGKNKETYVDEIIEAGFDIAANSIWLQEFYQGINKSRNNYNHNH